MRWQSSIPLFLLCFVACKPSVQTRPDPGKAAISATSSSSFAPPPASAVSSTEPPPSKPSGPRFELVAIRFDAPRTPALRLDDLGTHVVLTSRLPVGWAEGDKPLMPEARLKQGWKSREDLFGPLDERHVRGLGGSLPDRVFAIYGTLPEARGMTYDLPLHRLEAGGWAHVSPPLPKGTMAESIVPFGEKSVAVIAYATGDDTMPAAWDGPLTPQILIIDGGASAAPKKLPLADGIGDGKIIGTRSGHLFRMGPKATGLYVSHRLPDGSTTTHVVPGTEKCPKKKMRDHPIPSLFAGEGGHAFVWIQFSIEDDCKGFVAGLYEDKKTGFVRYKSSVPKFDELSVFGVSPDGTPWFGNQVTLHRGDDKEFELPAVRKKGDTYETYSPPPFDEKERNVDRCWPSSVLARKADGAPTSEEDVWIIGNCSLNHKSADVVFRWSKPQKVVVIDN